MDDVLHAACSWFSVLPELDFIEASLAVDCRFGKTGFWSSLRRSSKFPSQLFIGSCCPQLFNRHHLNTTCGCSMRKLMTNINWGQTINLRKKQQSVLIFHSQGLYLDFKPQSIDNFCLTFSGMFFFCSQISLIFVNFLQPHTAFNKEF